MRGLSFVDGSVLLFSFLSLCPAASSQSLQTHAEAHWGSDGACNTYNGGCSVNGTDLAQAFGDQGACAQAGNSIGLYGLQRLNATASCAPAALDVLLDIAGSIGPQHRFWMLEPKVGGRSTWSESWIVTGARGQGSVTFALGVSTPSPVVAFTSSHLVRVRHNLGAWVTLSAPYTVTLPMAFGASFRLDVELSGELRWDVPRCQPTSYSLSGSRQTLTSLGMNSIVVRDSNGAIVPNAKVGTTSSTHIPGITTPLPPRLYVDSRATGGNDGSSWSNAFRSLKDALLVAQTWPGGRPNGVSEIWIAVGTYYADDVFGSRTGSSSEHFWLMKGIEILGGFAGSETNVGQRDIRANPTILSGQLNGSTPNVQNVFRVGVTVDASGVLDGVTIRDGFANNIGGDSYTWRGGGMAISGGSPTIRSVRFVSNRAFGAGGAVAAWGVDNVRGASPRFVDCVFEGNSVTATRTLWGQGGGAIALSNRRGAPSGGARMELERCEMLGNSCYLDGGAIYTDGGGGPSLLRNVRFEGNSCQAGLGGGLCDRASNTANASRLEGCVFVNNSGGTAGGAYLNACNGVVNCTFDQNRPVALHVQSALSTGRIENSILWGAAPRELTGATATMVMYSIVRGGWSNGTGVRNLDPRFLAGTAIPSGGSPAIDFGDDLAVPSGLSADIAGQPRLVDHCAVAGSGAGGGVVDLGAYEVPCAVASSSKYGAGYPGTNGVPEIAVSARPVCGTAITIDIGNSAGTTTQAVLLVGWQATSWPLFGGTLLVDPLGVIALPIPLVPPAGVSTPPLTLPLNGDVCGLEVFAQALVQDSGASQGIAFTRGLKLTLGL